jgi:hypothetical protein
MKARLSWRPLSILVHKSTRSVSVGSLSCHSSHSPAIRVDCRGRTDIVAGARVHRRLAECQPVRRGQLVGGTSAHADNIARLREAATVRRGAGCDARPACSANRAGVGSLRADRSMASARYKQNLEPCAPLRLPGLFLLHRCPVLCARGRVCSIRRADAARQFARRLTDGFKRHRLSPGMSPGLFLLAGCDARPVPVH